MFPAVALWVTVGLAICLLVLLIALAYVCQKKIRQSCKEEKERAGNALCVSPCSGPERIALSTPLPYGSWLKGLV